MRSFRTLLAAVALVVGLGFSTAQGQQLELLELDLVEVDNFSPPPLTDAEAKTRDALQALVAGGQMTEFEAMLTKLEKEHANAAAAERLTYVYIELGRNLERQTAETTEEKKELRATLLSGFEETLTRIAKRPSTKFATLNWAAETFYALGSGTESRGQPTPASKRYMRQAADVYHRMAANLEKDERFGPQNTDKHPRARRNEQVRLDIRLAMCTRRAGDFAGALKRLHQVVDKAPGVIEAQLEAAYTLQDWGTADPVHYTEAIEGMASPQGGKGRIWGWKQLATLCEKEGQKKPDFQTYFFEARYNANYCRYLMAVAKSDAAAKSALLNEIETDILELQKAYPKLGDVDWAARFQNLYGQALRFNNKKGALKLE